MNTTAPIVVRTRIDLSQYYGRGTCRQVAMGCDN